MKSPNPESVSATNLSSRVGEARYCLQKYSAGRIREITAEIDTTISVMHTAGRLTVVRAGVLLPRNGEVDDSKAIIVNNPFANGPRAAQMTLRAMMLQKVIGNGQHPLMLFYENTKKDLAYGLTPWEMSMVDRGNFRSIAEQRAEAVDHLYPDAEKIVVGYSLGATIGALLAGRVDASHAVLADAPNTRNRTPKQLQKAFQAGGLGDLNRAITASNMPVLSELSGVTSTGKTTLRQLRSIAGFGLATLHAPNPAVKRGMTRDTFITDLAEIPAETDVTIARAEDSAILTRDDIDRVRRAAVADRFVTLEGFGHGAGDCITLMAELVLRATQEDASQ